MASHSPTADANLINHLRKFYSIGQLQIIQMTYTDGGHMPGLPDREKEMRLAAIRQILGEAPAPTITEPVTLVQPIESPKFPLDKATRFACNVVQLLEDYCDEIHIAGSIRREKAEVKDIEIVCRPKLWQAGNTGLFDTPGEPVIIPAFRREVESLGSVIKGKPDGRYMQILLPSTMKLDLFMPTATDYFRQFAIRTGSADYSAKVIAGGWKSKGWCGTDQGLRRITDCIEKPGGGWKCIANGAVLPPVWQSEEEFFDWLSIKWIEPKLRSV